MYETPSTPSMAAVPTKIPNLPEDFVRNWDEWSVKIVDAAKAEACAVRVCQKVFSAELVPEALAVPDDSLNLPIIDNIPEKPKQPLVEITMTFKLTATQMKGERDEKIGYILAQMNGRALGQIQDLFLLNGFSATTNPLFTPLLSLVTVTNLRSTDNGLLGAAEPS